ncbi:uncharacterized protein TNCV_3235381 [Trichonephila clavipes]|nr:uncharacterized protein TNCV_3235381 [Trichonephila clavipes]
MNFNGFSTTIMFSFNVHIYTDQDALLVGFQQSLDNAQSFAFSQRTRSPRLIEDETFHDGDIINNLIDYKDGQEELDSLRVDKIYAHTHKDPAFQQLEKHFLKINTNSKRSLKFPKKTFDHAYLVIGTFTTTDLPTIVTKTYH